MKQRLVKGYDNNVILDQSNPYEFFSGVKISDITESDLRIAVQSYKLATKIIDSYVKKIKE